MSLQRHKKKRKKWLEIKFEVKGVSGFRGVVHAKNKKNQKQKKEYTGQYSIVEGQFM